jgi:mycothiol system anti-sigma-R factor
MMDCKEVGAALFLFFDNEMEEDLLAPFRDHVSGCGSCAKQVDYTRRLLLIVREKCIRCTAPERLRMRILTSLPHRGFFSGPH